MTLDSESFLALCKELRKLGACKVEGFGFSATFVPIAGQPLPQELRPRPVGMPKAPRSRKDEPTAEQLREQAYARELGVT